MSTTTGPASARTASGEAAAGARGTHGAAGGPRDHGRARTASRRRRVLEVGARVAGVVLGHASGLVRRVRVRPLHPDGLVLAGRVHRTGVPEGGRASGVAWLDTPGADDVLVRFSRGGGLPRVLPDVHGLALRSPETDLLLSTALGGVPGLRHVPWPRRRHGTALYSSLLSFEGPHGPVMVAARVRGGPRRLPADRDRLASELRRAPLLMDLLWATPSSRWRPFGVLAIMATSELAGDRLVRLDPLRTPPGLSTQRWVRDLRAPAYAAARGEEPP